MHWHNRPLEPVLVRRARRDILLPRYEEQFPKETDASLAIPSGFHQHFFEVKTYVVAATSHRRSSRHLTRF